MKILQICCNLAGSKVFPQLFSHLAERGIGQTVIVPEKSQKNIGKNEPDGVPVRWMMTVRKTDALFFFRKAQRTVPEILKTENLDDISLIHAHTLFTDGSIAEHLSRRTGIPFIVTLRYSDMEAIWKYEPHLHPMGRNILRKAKAVVFLSEASRGKVLNTWVSGNERELLEKKSLVIPNGIDSRWLDGSPKGGPGDPVRVGFAGLYNNRKCPLDALEAVHLASAASKRKFIFRAAGSGPLEEKLKERLQPGDVLAGHKDGMEEMKRFYADCDMLLVPSSAETFGMVYLEAMSQGLPVLYTKGQGFDGQFAEGQAGYAVPCGNPKAQAQALLRLLDGYKDRSARCIELARSYEWKLVCGKWEELYHKVQ